MQISGRIFTLRKSPSQRVSVTCTAAAQLFITHFEHVEYLARITCHFCALDRITRCNRRRVVVVIIANGIAIGHNLRTLCEQSMHIFGKFVCVWCVVCCVFCVHATRASARARVQHTTTDGLLAICSPGNADATPHRAADIADVNELSRVDIQLICYECFCRGFVRAEYTTRARRTKQAFNCYHSYTAA